MSQCVCVSVSKCVSDSVCQCVNVSPARDNPDPEAEEEADRGPAQTSTDQPERGAVSPEPG